MHQYYLYLMQVSQLLNEKKIGVDHPVFGSITTKYKGAKKLRKEAVRQVVENKCVEYCFDSSVDLGDTIRDIVHLIKDTHKKHYKYLMTTTMSDNDRLKYLEKKLKLTY